MNSVVIKYADRTAIKRAVAEYVGLLKTAHPKVQRVLWFGSWVTGLPSPGSDVDLCVIISDSDKPRRLRAPDYLPVGFPVGIDLLVYTTEEFDRLRVENPSWYATLTSGRNLFDSTQGPNETIA